VVTNHHRTPSSNGPRVCTLYKNFQIICRNMFTKAMLCEQLSQKLHPDTVRALARWEPLLLSFSLASSCYGGNTITTPSFVCECWIADNELQESRTGCCLLLTQIYPWATCIHSIAWGKDGSKCLLHTLRSPVPVIWSAWTWVFMTYRSFSPSSFTRLASLSAVLSTGSTNCNPPN
jgi:hypothetical protein